MSMILITHHNETIYDIDQISTLDSEKEKEDPNKQHAEFLKFFKTDYNRAIKQEAKKLERNKRPYGIMGLPKQPLPDPKSYLRKHTGKVFAVDPNELEVVKYDFPKKEPVPKTICAVYEQMNKLNHNKKNFVHENVKKVLEMKPKIPIRKEIIDVKSRSFRIIPKEPEQVSNKIFAKIPRYLDAMIKHRQAEIEAENERKGIVKQKCTYITRDERKMLLEGLKKNWDELQRFYQGLPILTDTIPKKARKRDLENQLHQLEKDIVLIERHPFIYVYDEEESV